MFSNLQKVFATFVHLVSDCVFLLNQLHSNQSTTGHASFCPCFAAAAAKSYQSCPTLCDPSDGSPPGSPVPGILQARMLEWVAITSPMHACMLSHFSHVRSVRSHRQQPTRLPCPRDSPGKNTEVSHQFLLHSMQEQL